MSVLGDAGVPALGAFPPRRIMRDEIIETLRAAVISGQLTPNHVYSAPILAEQFGVSPTPVREAMIQLANDGLFESVRNKGFRVREPSEEELDELAELRMLLRYPRCVASRRSGSPRRRSPSSGWSPSASNPLPPTTTSSAT